MSVEPQQQENPSVWQVWSTVLLTVGGFLLFTVMMILILTFGRQTETYEAERDQLRAETRQSIDEASAERLTGYGWVDEEAGLVRVPLEEGIQLAMRQLQEKPVRASEVSVPRPAPVAAAVAEDAEDPDAEPAEEEDVETEPEGEPEMEDLPVDELEDPEAAGAEEIEAATEEAEQAEEDTDDQNDEPSATDENGDAEEQEEVERDDEEREEE